MLQESESILKTLTANIGASFIIQKTPLAAMTDDPNNLMLHYVKKGAMVYFVSMAIDMAVYNNMEMTHDPITMADETLSNAVILFALDELQFSRIVDSINPLEGEMGSLVATASMLTALQLISDKIDNSPLHLVKNIASYLKLKLNL